MVSLAGVVNKIKEINTPKKIDDSVSLRFLTLSITLLSFSSAFAANIIKMETFLLSALLSIVGSSFAYFERRKNRLLTKIFLSIGLLLVLLLYLLQVRRYYLDTRIALSTLLINILVLHSFDLPERKDLIFSVIASTLLLAASSTFAMENQFLVYVVSFFILLTLFVILDAASEGGLNPDTLFLKAPLKLATKFASFALLTFVLAMIVFIAIPRPKGAFYAGLPVSLRKSPVSISGFDGRQVSAYYSNMKKHFPRIVKGSYFGTADYLNLNVRGNLSSDVVYLVKTTAPSYYRASVFTRYDGRGWSQDKSLKPEMVEAMAYGTPVPQREPYFETSNDVQVLSIFTVKKEVSNSILSPYRPDMAYLPFERYWVDEALVLRAPFILPEDTIYTIESSVKTDVETLVEEIRNKRPEIYFRKPRLERVYYELPKNLPERVEALALKLTKGVSDPYVKVEKILDYLHKNFQYRLDIPYFPKDVDVVDYFLFKTRAGYCEHFASAFVVLARASGVPARLVTGYAEGDYNPFTGYYEIKEKHGHAWAEIYLNGVGWVSVEPTPGFDDPHSVVGRSQGFETIRFFGRKLKSVLDFVGLGDMSVLPAKIRLYKGAVILAIALTLVLVILLNARRRAFKIVNMINLLIGGRKKSKIVQILSLLKKLGYPRNSYETIRETLLKTPYPAEAEKFLLVYERWAYGDSASRKEVEKEADELLSVLKGRRSF